MNDVVSEVEVYTKTASLERIKYPATNDADNGEKVSAVIIGMHVCTHESL